MLNVQSLWAKLTVDLLSNVNNCCPNTFHYLKARLQTEWGLAPYVLTIGWIKFRSLCVIKQISCHRAPQRYLVLYGVGAESYQRHGRLMDTLMLLAWQEFFFLLSQSDLRRNNGSESFMPPRSSLASLPPSDSPLVDRTTSQSDFPGRLLQFTLTLQWETCLSRPPHPLVFLTDLFASVKCAVKPKHMRYRRSTFDNCIVMELIVWWSNVPVLLHCH